MHVNKAEVKLELLDMKDKDTDLWEMKGAGRRARAAME